MAASFSIRCGQEAADTGGGTQNFTVSGFGTPKAVAFFVSKATVNGTPAADALIGYGFTDGTNQYCCVGTSEDGVSTTNVHRRQATDECIQIIDTDGTILGEAAFTQWVTDGVQVTWGVTPAAAYLITFVLFGGSDLTAEVGTDVLSTSPNADLGAEPDLILTAGIATDAVDTDQDFFGIFFGAIVNNGMGQFVNCLAVPDNQSSTTAGGQLLGNYFATDIAPLTSSIGYRAKATHVTSTGFAWDGSDTDIFGFLALTIAGGGVAISEFVLPTGTGEAEHYGAPFTPEAVILVTTPLTTKNSIVTSSVVAQCIGVADGTSEYSVAVSDEDGITLGTTNAESHTNNKLIHLYDYQGSTGANVHQATLTGFQPGGMKLNHTATLGVAGRGFAIWLTSDPTV